MLYSDDMRIYTSSFFTHGTYILFAVILLTFLFFPSVYIRVSQSLFSSLYRYNAPSAEINVTSEYVYMDGKELTPLYTMVRPPQVPYDFILATRPPMNDEPDIVSKYVYNDRGIAVGYIHEKRDTIYVIVLFSSSVSRELFSVNGHISSGTGTGGGSFYLSTPIDADIVTGLPIVHQATGGTVSTVSVIERFPEKNVQRVHGIIAVNPLQTPMLYIRAQDERKIFEHEFEQAKKRVDTLHSESAEIFSK